MDFRYLVRPLIRVSSEPLLHFLLLGGLIFLVAGWRGGKLASEQDPLEIVILPETRQLLMEQPQAVTAEREDAFWDFVREEILRQEAVALGLDRHDRILARHMGRKLMLYLEASQTPAEPTEAMLEDWFRRHQERYELPGVVDFRHVFFSEKRRGVKAFGDAEDRLLQLREEDDPQWPVDGGDPFIHGQFIKGRLLSEVAHMFGPTFAETIAEVPLRQWQGPWESPFGFHLVWVEARQSPRLPLLDSVYSRVLADYYAHAQSQHTERAVCEIVSRYRLRVGNEPPRVIPCAPERR